MNFNHLMQTFKKLKQGGAGTPGIGADGPQYNPGAYRTFQPGPMPDVPFMPPAQVGPQQIALGGAPQHGGGGLGGAIAGMADKLGLTQQVRAQQGGGMGGAIAGMAGQLGLGGAPIDPGFSERPLGLGGMASDPGFTERPYRLGGAPQGGLGGALAGAPHGNPNNLPGYASVPGQTPNFNQAPGTFAGAAAGPGAHTFNPQIAQLGLSLLRKRQSEIQPWLQIQQRRGGVQG